MPNFFSDDERAAVESLPARAEEPEPERAMELFLALIRADINRTLKEGREYRLSMTSAKMASYRGELTKKFPHDQAVTFRIPDELRNLAEHDDLNVDIAPDEGDVQEVRISYRR